MSAFTAETLDFSRLDAPTLIAIEYEPRLAEIAARFVVYWEKMRETRPELPAFDTEKLNQDPAVVILQAYTYGDMALRAATNDAANSLRLPFAVKSDLDYLAQTYHRTKRQLLVAANAQTGAPAVYEGDEEYRARAQLAPEASAEKGYTGGGYIYTIKTQFADRVKGVYPINRGAGRVELRILGRQGDGAVPLGLIEEIAAAFAPEDGTESTDVVTILPAEIVYVTPSVTLYLPTGPDRTIVEKAAKAAIATLGASLHRLKAPVFREAVSSAAHVGPVVTVRVNDPLADLAGRPEAAPFFMPAIVDFGTL